ncbi:UNVERIFIED_CONTAM: hypothetical protein RMT77_016690 [Armadillidium vulgare]
MKVLKIVVFFIVLFNFQKKYVHSLSLKLFLAKNVSSISTFSENFLREFILTQSTPSNFLFIMDEVSVNNIDMDFMMKELAKTTSTAIFSNIEDFKTEDFDWNVITGNFYKVCIILYKDVITKFFDKISHDQRWAPSYLSIVSLNPETHFNSSLFTSSIQRSKFIFIAEIMEKFEKYFVNTYSLYPAEKFVNGKSVWKIRLGQWKSSRSVKDLFINRLKTFNWSVIKTATSCNTFINFPFVFPSTNGSCTGVNVDIFKMIAAKNYFYVNISSRTEDNLWGEYINGSWHGMMREIISGKKNISINTHILTPQKLKYFGISHTFYIQNFAFLSMKPLPLPSWMKLITPFSTRMWLFTFIVIFVVNTSGIIFFKVSHNQANCDSFRLLLEITGLIFRQNFMNKYSSLWMKLFIGIWALMIFILTTAYSSTLVSNLTHPSYPPIIKSLKELAASNIKQV